MVPEGWTLYRFEELVADTQLGTTQRGAGEVGGESVPLLKMGNLTWGGVSLQKVEYLHADSVESELMLEEGDFLFNTRNTPQLVGKSAVWSDQYGEATFDNNINRIRFRPGVNPNYICYYLTTGKGKALIRSIPAGSTSVAAIYWKDLRKIKLVLPQILEQQEIAKILSTWDEAIATTEQLLANSEQQKKALMQQLLTGRKRLPGFGSPGLGGFGRKAIPNGWSCLKIGDVAEKVADRNKVREEIPVLSCSKHDGFVDSLKYFNKKVYSDDTSNYKIIRRGEFGFPANHVEEGSIGLQSTYDSGIVSPIYVVFRVDPERVDEFFLYKVLKTDHYRQVFAASTSASVDRRGSLRWRQFSTIKVSLPSLEEQRAISRVIQLAEDEEKVLRQSLERLHSEKKALMQQLLTGKRRVKVDKAERTTA